MSGSETRDDGWVAKAQALLAALPPVPQKPPTKSQRIAQLAPAIAEARNKGYSLRFLAALVKRHGIEVSYTTFVTALSPARPRRKPRAATSAKPSPSKVAATKPAALSVPPPARKPVEKPAAPVFPPGATFIPIGNGQFLPAPDTEDL